MSITQRIAQPKITHKIPMSTKAKFFLTAPLTIRNIAQMISKPGKAKITFNQTGAVSNHLTIPFILSISFYLRYFHYNEFITNNQTNLKFFKNLHGNNQFGKNKIMKFGHNVFFENENDEVLVFDKRSINIDEAYKYISHNPIYKFWSWFTYRFLAIPYAFFVFRLIKNIKFYNTKVLKQYKKSGYFIYANHTNQFADGFCPALICFPQKPYLIVNSSNVAIPFARRLTKMWGAIPLPDNIKSTKNFYNAIEHVLNKKNPIVIYPEAHLWPYYTKIRNFSSSAFRYPVKYNKPVFTFTTTYKLKKYGRKPKVEIYVDGPFFHDKNLNEKDSQQKLRDQVYIKLCERANLNNYEYVNYIKREKAND